MHRRHCLLTLGALLGASTASAQDAAAFAPAQQLLRGRTLLGTGLELELPALSENGGAVPLSVAFRGTPPAGETVVAIHLLATRNPNPGLLSLELHGDRVLPDFATRVRLAESQTVIAVALGTKNSAWVAQRKVQVTVSGCLGPGEAAPNESMRSPRIALARNPKAGGPIEVKALVQHPMETGMRPGSDGKPLPQNLVRDFTLRLGERPALTVRFQTGTSENPYLRFLLPPPSATEAAVFTWTDQAGRTLREERPLPV